MGKFEGVNVFETNKLGYGNKAGGIALPGRGIVTGKGVYSEGLGKDILQHEFGHILQSRKVGLVAYYKVIAKESALSGAMHGKMGWDHYSFWTETWANYLSHKYFGVNSVLNTSKWPIQNIGWFDFLRLRRVSPLLFP